MEPTSAKPTTPASTPAAPPSRRDIFKMTTAAAIAAAATTLPISQTAWAAASDSLKYGLIGCGGRGRGAAGNAMRASTGNKLVALADLWPDKVESAVKGL